MTSRSTRRDAQVIVVGGGIIGIACAAYLAEIGRDVLVVDRSGVCEETSAGNAGAFAFSDILPMAHKDMLSQVPGWLMDPLGPLSIPPTYLPKLMPWLWRFARAGREDLQDRAVVAQAAMMALAEREWGVLMTRSGTAHMLREDGCLELYESEAAFAAAKEDWQLRRRYQIAFQHLGRDEIAAYQPGLSERFMRATFVPGWKTVDDPQQLGQAIWVHAEHHGARFIPGLVTAAQREAENIAVDLAGGRRLTCEWLVIAAGAWSKPLARIFGDTIPLEAERGYNTTLPADAFDIKRQLVFPRHGFVITPLENGIRVGGAVEFGGLKRAPNYARARAMLDKAARFLPGLKTEGGRQWMGYRPSLPDSLPVIDRARSEPRVLYAFGHGHLGLTQAAATGRLIRDLVVEQTPPIELRPYRARRFKEGEG